MLKDFPDLTLHLKNNDLAIRASDTSSKYTAVNNVKFYKTRWHILEECYSLHSVLIYISTQS